MKVAVAALQRIALLTYPEAGRSTLDEIRREAEEALIRLRGTMR